MRKSVFGVSDQVRYKPGCTDIENGKRLEISDLVSRGIVLLNPVRFARGSFRRVVSPWVETPLF